MKKIIGIVFFIAFSISFLEAAGIYDDPCINGATQECCCQHPSSTFCGGMNYDCNGQGSSSTNNDTGGCDPSKIYRLPEGGTGCCPGVVDENGTCQAGLSDLGINITTDCLLNGQCSLNVYKVLGIRKSNENPTVLGFFQDITLASTTAILGTVLVIALIVSGLVFSFASITGKDTKRSKSILIDCLVGVLLVWGAYAIIRLIQFLATAGS